MEAQTDLQTYLEQGKQALAQGKGRDAAIAYAHGAQMEPNNPLVHLGLAEANVALGSYDIARMACKKTQELVSSGPIYHLAQALLELLDKRYERALYEVDESIKDDPANAYAHALRAYLLRANHQDYDAGLARGRASRLSFGGKFENCFPVLEPVYGNGYKAQNTGFIPAQTPTPTPSVETSTRPQQQEQIPAWSRPNANQRNMIRARFFFSQNPRILTFILMGLNILVYLVLALMSQNLFEINQDVLVNMGAQVNLLVQQGQYWRIFTAMFLHFNLWHIAINMLSLFFVGGVTELFYGKLRYLAIYLLSGIIGGIVTYMTAGADVLAAGASGAIFGIFGAVGAFYIVNRRALGPAGNAMLGQWVVWLLINLFYGFSVAGIGIQDHLGGLVAGLILGLILLPPLHTRIRRVR